MSKQLVIVFGATGKIGPQVCRTLAQEGWIVGVHYNTNKTRAELIVDDITDKGGKAFAVSADVCDEESLGLLLEMAAARNGSIDGVVDLVHRDRGYSPTLVEQMSWDNDWKIHIDALHAYFNICKGVLPYMKRQNGGRIIYLSGGLAYRFYKGMGAFSAVKAGANALSKTLALEAGAYNITVNIISPGRVVTPEEAQRADRFAEDDVSKCPLGRFASPDDIANAASFLLSPKAAFITGQTIYISGGEIMPMP